MFAYDAFKASFTSPLANSQLGPGARYLIRMSVFGLVFRCRVDGLAGDGGAIFHAMEDELVEPAHAGFLVENASVRYHYLVIYQLGT